MAVRVPCTMGVASGTCIPESASTPLQVTEMFAMCWQQGLFRFIHQAPPHLKLEGALMSPVEGQAGMWGAT